jgi:hypothetical protein
MNFPKGFSSGVNLVGHKVTGWLLVKLFALRTTRFRQIFAPKAKVKKLTKNSKKFRCFTANSTEQWRPHCQQDEPCVITSAVAPVDEATINYKTSSV